MYKLSSHPIQEAQKNLPSCIWILQMHLFEYSQLPGSTMSYNTNPWFLFISGSFITHLGSRYAQIYCRIIPALLHVSCKTLVTLFNLDASVYEFVKWNASIFFFPCRFRDVLMCSSKFCPIPAEGSWRMIILSLGHLVLSPWPCIIYLFKR